MSKDEFLKIKTCVLKVHLHCDGCRNKVKKILQKIDGVYTFNIEQEQGKVTVSGDLDPETLIKNMAKHGKHVEIWPEVVPNLGNPNQIKNMQHEKGKAGGKKGANPSTIHNANQRKTGQKQVKGQNPNQKQPEKDELAGDHNVVDDGKEDEENENENEENEDEVDGDQNDNGKSEKLPLMGNSNNNDKKGGGMGKNGGKKGGGGGDGGGKNEGKKGGGGDGGGGVKNDGKKSGGGGGKNEGKKSGGGGGKNGEKNMEGGSEDGKKGDKKRGEISNDDLINSGAGAGDVLYFPAGIGAPKQLTDINEMFMYPQVPPPTVNYLPHPCPYYHYPYPYPYPPPFTYPQSRPDPYMHAFSDENQSPTCCIM